ncbi:MAG: bifunctional DNA-formamidopyrimidine glycosylase/DNA-(apurinic or apyrimidinic site) lyase [Gemmatimonadota bacterium]|nr:bifunctional DNA-formamidopyrimidine glycosylase/DNA-(apurinic or apyrimidinic site) lyase [Gemmatimonadota bacterium]
MPELPEVETIVRDLARLAVGATIREVEVIRPDVVEGEDAASFATVLRGCTIDGVSRRAKNIVLALGEVRLVVNLGMTGRLLVAGVGEPEPSHVAVRMPLHDGRTLLYHDVRRFGRLRRFSESGWVARASEMGPEPLDPEWTPERLLDGAGRSRVAVKSWLMDQRRVVGVGNIYASEALFRAGIDPRRPAQSLVPDEAAGLHAAIRDVLREAIEFRGTTLLDYRDAAGERGGFAERLQVYGRVGEPCRRCAAPLVRIVQGGRSTFLCGNCQR